ncbi:MAG: DUF488 domain-containing protein [Alphaproteobacteria bacterium]|nr:DUF488 domain-containing protein [Alphaproteobacteria bacterium]MCW5742147.1 DUF488 domain-containing protein [Alphaproteobacteria bacterium]
MSIFTIGHSNHPIERFVALLRDAGVTLLADVRSTPYSRRVPHFNRERLRDTLKAAGIDYRHLGGALGGKPQGGERDYIAMARTPAFIAALDAVMEESSRQPLALMCAEREPLDCHRTILVSRHLATRGADIVHLLADGGRAAHADIEAHLVAWYERRAGPLLAERDPARRLAAAYDERGAAMTGR